MTEAKTFSLDCEVFFKSARASVFGGALSQAQVDGCNAILTACRKYGVVDQHHVSHVLAEVRHETGGYMLPIKETVMPHHKDKNPSDATVIKRLNDAYAAGRLPWVSAPYWLAGWFGRGPIQATHEHNYKKIGDKIGVDLVKNRDRILEPEIGAASAVIGLRDGVYTGKKLADYNFPAALDAVPKAHPRRMVNGVDGTDAAVSTFHRAFFVALTAGRFRIVSQGTGGVSDGVVALDLAPVEPAPRAARLIRTDPRSNRQSLHQRLEEMTVWIRILLYVLAGWLYGSGYIGAEVRNLLTDDPRVVATLEPLVSSLVFAIAAAWWKWAKRKGWAT